MFNMSKQIKSKARVEERGEVFTDEREVTAMLDLVSIECLRPDSRFLEPACGNGNFLVAILERKLDELKRKYRSAHRDYEKQSIIAIGSLYGVDIMRDNVEECRTRLFDIWDKKYKAICKKDCSDEARESVRFILRRNIVCGNALTLNCVDENGNDLLDQPIVFSEWSMISGTQMQRRDYTFAELLARKDNDIALFNGEAEGKFVNRYITHYKNLQPNG